MGRLSALGTRHYRPHQWDEVSNWKLYPMGRGEKWMGFDAICDLDGLPPEILLVPLPGHTWGHSGVAIDTGAGWLLYCGDAYFYHGEVGRKTPKCPPGMALYQTMMEVDCAARVNNQKRLRSLSLDRKSEVTLFCAHDRVEFDRMRYAVKREEGRPRLSPGNS